MKPKNGGVQERFHIVEQLGPRRYKTPEGFLICQDVPIARVGLQMYAPKELPLEEYDFTPAPDGVYRVYRHEEEVFGKDAMLSVVGKPVTNDHPTQDVNLENWRKLAMGHALHPRRGDGVEDDVLFADLFITDQDMIDEIESGKREVSCGYDVDYFELSPGVLEQRNIRINHVALVKQGRCGPRCAIGDSATADPPEPQPTEATMAAPETRRSLKDRILSCFMKDDKQMLARVLEEVEDFEPRGTRDEGAGGQGIHLHMGGSGSGDEGPPPWFKEHVTGNDKRISDIENAVGNLASAFQEWAKGESKEPEHAGDEAVEGEEEEGEKKAPPPPKGKDKKRKGDAKAKGEAAEEEEPAEDESTEEEPPEEIEGEIGEEAPAGSEENPPGKDRKSKDKAKDSAMLQESFGETLALAEVLVPGIVAPAFDAKARPEITLATIKDFRRKTLDLAYTQAETRAIIDNIIGPRRKLKTKDMKASDLRTVFRAAGAAKKAANNAKLRSTADTIFGPGNRSTPPGAIKTLNDYQAMLNQHYAPKA